MTTGWYKVQLWLDEHMIEEPTLPLAQAYADVTPASLGVD